MWIEWKEARVLMCQAGKDSMVRVIPGFQLIEDKEWNRMRSALVEKIKTGAIVEIGAKVIPDQKGPGGKPMPDAYEGTNFNDLSVKQQDEIISGCYSVEQLNALRQTAKESTRIAIANQIDSIEKNKIKKPKK